GGGGAGARGGGAGGGGGGGGGGPAEPAWLQQVHGNRVVAAETVCEPVAADAAWTREPGRPCVVMTADCLPILLFDPAATVVAAVHA
ncbi:MAG TPA: laccase domain-containing protein, partial [Candidatus Competibacter sp.]|nr:laccase domain-containing protein [Candidatus Competibacter sp.]